jgi:serine/threonine protein kinase
LLSNGSRQLNQISIRQSNLPARLRGRRNVSTLSKAGRYELREELGRGSMGVVHRAYDPVIGRDVAVKTLHISETGTGMSRAELVSRFQTEARAAGLLTHPNIVVVYDAGESEGIFHITMELVEGRSLQTLIDGRQLFPLSRILKIMEQVCSALEFAHRHNVVHRDIKPANLMLTADDTVKITDFGTAKILQFGTAQTAHVMGTPSYMSPEQVKGKTVDGRSDIFSLGVILYEMLTGEKPFPGQNITTVIYKIINEEPIPPQSLDSSIHVGLSNVIKRALAKDPSARYPTCTEFINALKSYHDSTGTDASLRTPRPPATRNSAPVAKPQPMLTPLRPAAPDSSVLLIPAAVEQPGMSRRGSVVLTLLLLGVIGYAGYRVWPPMMDLWQRMHEAPATAAPKAPALPASSAAPGTQGEKVSGSDAPPTAPVSTTDATTDSRAKSNPTAEASDTTSPATAGVTVAGDTDAKNNSVTAKTAAAAPVENPNPTPVPTAASPAAITANTSAEAAKKVTPAAPPPSATSLYQAKLRSQMGASLADKVKLAVNGASLGISGQLTSAEYHRLLALLKSSPPGLKIIDNVEVVAAHGGTPIHE